MKSVRFITLVIILLATQGFEAAPVNAKSGGGAQGSSGDSPSGGSGNRGGRPVGTSQSGTVTVDARGAGSGIGTPTGLESGGPSGPSSASGSNRDKESDIALGDSIGGPLGFGSSWHNRPHSTWFNGFGGNSQVGSRSFGSQTAFPEQMDFDGVEGRFGQPGGPSGLLGQRGQDWFGSLEDRQPGGFGVSNYQGSIGGLFGSQGGQGDSNVFGGPFEGGSSGGAPEFDSVLGGLGGHGNLENPSRSPNFGGLGDQGGQGGLTETDSFGRGLLHAISGLSNFRSQNEYSGGVGQVFGSRSSASFGQRLLALLPPRSRGLARQYFIYRKNGGRMGFFRFLRKLRLGVQRSLGDAQTGAFFGSSGSSSQGSNNNLGEEQFIYWPKLWSEGSYRSSFGSSAGYSSGFGDTDDAFSQQSL